MPPWSTSLPRGRNPCDPARMRNARRQLGWLVGVLAGAGLALGCGPSAGALDGGGGGGGATRGSQCTQVMNTLCQRLASCGVVPTDQVAICVDSGIEACCGGDCATPVVSTQQNIDRCIADANAATCAVLDVTMGGTLPASCQGVVRSALTTTSQAALGTEAGGAPARVGRLVSSP